MYKKIFLLPVLFGLIAVFFVSCDKDYNTLGADIVGEDHFYLEHKAVTIKAYNQKLGPVASNNLPINPFGFYANPAFGNTQANFVTQVELAVSAPVFNNAVMDSVILEIPYFSTLTGASTVDGETIKTYELDSIYGPSESKFKLSVYQSNYYLRNLDPSQGLGEAQSYFTDQDADIDNNKVPVLLNDHPITNTINKDGVENSQFYFDRREHETSVIKDGKTSYTRTPPSMRLHLSNEVFTNLILNAPSGQLADNNTFKNYFRGLYFKAENGNPGQMAMINFKGGKVTLYYQEDKSTTDNTKIPKTLVLNLTGNTVSLLNNSDEKSNYVDAINNPSQEASRLYLKGGEGAVTVIDLFGKTDVKKVDTDPNGKLVLVDGSNGVSDEIDQIKVEGWLINDATLTFNIDQGAMTGASEPQRVFLYDLTNSIPLIDYVFDGSSSVSKPKNNKMVYGGIIQKETLDGKGIKYAFKITNHIRNLIKNNTAANVRLGLSVTENINNIAFSKLKTSNSNFDKVPSMSVMNPLGTILYGTNLDVPEENRLKLEIYYTKPN